MTLFDKAYGHYGYFKALVEIVHFEHLGRQVVARARLHPSRVPGSSTLNSTIKAPVRAARTIRWVEGFL